MDGFYVEVRQKGSTSKGVIIRSVTEELMQNTVKQYEKANKDVIVLGEHKNNEWLSPAPKKPKTAVNP
jgi:hypothetical protein